jgi:dihydrofolate reductase
MATIWIIAAVADNQVIGREGDLPWRLPDDMRHFMRLTRGHAVIMGRRTYESLDGPLPNRRNIVVTSQSDYADEGVETAPDLETALSRCADDELIFIAGGQRIYADGLAHAERMILTHVHASPEGDTYFPSFDPSQWKIIDEEHHPADDRHAHPFTFRTWQRVNSQ